MKPDIHKQQVNRAFLFKNRADIKKKNTEEQEIINALTNARNEWLDTVTSFEQAYEENLVDYYTYKMKACEARYAYFIKKAREMGLKASVPQEADSIQIYSAK